MTRECQEDEHDWTGRRNQQDDKVESELLGHAYLDWMHMDQLVLEGESVLGRWWLEVLRRNMLT